jgi:dTDP-4-dehydrorhamnose reductase
MLGSEMLEQCRARGHEAVAPVRAEVDLTSPAGLERFFQNNKFEALVNCAGFSRVDDCEEPAPYAQALAVNATAPGWLAKFCKKAGSLLVHYSTDYVFDGEKEGLYLETDEPNPLNAYGRTKWMGERAILDQGPAFYLIRTSWLYGPRGKNFVKTLVGLLKTRARAEVVDDQRGAPTSTKDLAEFTLGLLEGKAERGLYHFSNSGETTRYGAALEIQKRMGLGGCEIVPVPSGKNPRPARRPANSRFNLDKAVRAWGRPIRPWAEALKEYLEKDLPRETA